MPGWRSRSVLPNLKHPEPNGTKCKICGRVPIKITKHHLIPRGTLGKKGLSTVAKLCRTCHAMLHSIFTNTFIAEHLNTVDKLRAHPQVKAFGEFASKQPIFETYSRREILERCPPAPGPA